MTLLRKTTQKSIKKNTPKEYEFCLYTVGKTPNCVAAFDNLKKICEEYLPQRYRIEVIDLSKLPQLAKDEQILAIPTVIKKLPLPSCKVIGNLSNKEQVLVGLDLKHPLS